ncbi:MAG: carbohydrate-binding family 9-like protein [Anaerolineae bacterium]|nr:carbohydrate-binding family 9-like protein [Anaerolineae bacterium]
MFKMPRSINLPQGALDKLNMPPVREYNCLRTDTPIVIDGALNEEAWQRVEWSTPFVKMDTGAQVQLDSRVALLWDDTFLYAAYKFEDHEIWGTHVEHHDHVYNYDSDAEIFVQGDGVYYELGVNPINTIYEVFWTWLEPVVKRQDAIALDKFFKTENFLYFEPRLNDKLGRFGEMDWELPGLKHAVRVDGSLNCPAVRDNGWTVEFALPWQGLAALGKPVPPQDGDLWRIGTSRCQHFHDAQGNNIWEDWSWNRHGYINMHIPERWSKVRFCDKLV